jgi:hypothetical protein
MFIFSGDSKSTGQSGNGFGILGDNRKKKLCHIVEVTPHVYEFNNHCKSTRDESARPEDNRDAAAAARRSQN